MKCNHCGQTCSPLREKRLDDGFGGAYCSQECVDKSNEEIKPLIQRGEAIVRGILDAELVGFNNGLSWAAKWIESSVAHDDNERTKEFAANMAMSIRAARKIPENEVGIGVIE